MSRFTFEDIGIEYQKDSQYFDSYNKFFIYGDSTNTIDRKIRIYNKVGVAYGALTDISYIRDYQKKIEFFLSATIYVNQNQIVNDNIYEYINAEMVKNHNINLDSDNKNKKVVN